MVLNTLSFVYPLSAAVAEPLMSSETVRRQAETTTSEGSFATAKGGRSAGSSVGPPPDVAPWFVVLDQRLGNNPIS